MPRQQQYDHQHCRQSDEYHELAPVLVSRGRRGRSVVMRLVYGGLGHVGIITKPLRGASRALDGCRGWSENWQCSSAILWPTLPAVSYDAEVCVGVVLVVSGLCWAMVGVAHLVRLSRMTGANAPSDGMAAFGSFLDVAAFIIPGVLLAFLGLVLHWRAKRAQRRATGATPPRPVSPPVMRPFTLAVLTAIAACTASARGTTAVPAVSTTAGTDESAKLETRTIRATSNPILADGRDYTADPAPLVANGQLYIITGRDTAGPGVNDFNNARVANAR